MDIEESGGYFIEMDAYADAEQAWFRSNLKQIPVTIKYPKDEDIIPEQKYAIKSHFEWFEKSFFSYNYKDAQNGFRKYLDVETFINRFLIQEISGNPDSFWSVFMYKYRNEDKFYFSPVWDFDIAYDNDGLLYPTNDRKEWLHDGNGRMASEGVRDIIKRIFTDEVFYSDLQARYYDLCNRGILTEASLLKTVDDYALELDQSQKLNFIRWDILNIPVHQNPKAYGSYAAEVENVKDYLRKRIAWMDNKLNYKPSGISDVSDSSTVAVSVNGNELFITGITGLTKLKIVNINGIIEKQKEIKAGFSTPLAKGIYIIQLIEANKNPLTFKRIIY
ncbi:hypothetical protein FACS189421_02150 [Bacteroidia bacterium]|nr:hypothetical protein FACS189421_02150 [Bacteroidia bacterium]GHT49466.1 hypothetical protein FACS189440_15290 [Bacteroidia bacterium]